MRLLLAFDFMKKVGKTLLTISGLTLNGVGCGSLLIIGGGSVFLS